MPFESHNCDTKVNLKIFTLMFVRTQALYGNGLYLFTRDIQESKSDGVTYCFTETRTYFMNCNEYKKGGIALNTELNKLLSV